MHLQKRLNEKFDYSDNLNEDHLRGLMGKAVTRRRTELIALIRKDGERPQNVGVEVWERLQLLADSKQREEKTEQGRYANACRKTLGRAGSLGENGIRLRLREAFGRSPDPDEVLQEMQRYKGLRRKEDRYGDDKNNQGNRNVDNFPVEEALPYQNREKGWEECKVAEVHERKLELGWRSASKV